VEKVKKQETGDLKGYKLFIAGSVTFTFLYRDSTEVYSGP